MSHVKHMSHAIGCDKLWGGLPFCVSDRHTERQIDREIVSQTHSKANRQTDRVYRYVAILNPYFLISTESLFPY